ncbi:PREDICTED: zinc finger protein 423-like [Vollenhovia emeryi]|uniref:zinc finger protein 423-like n=1 Tax=Vollenhovia emeryi TaxID=411798 RepID=UPI0005F3E91E|nr:PREDICTED: zinc finger protein 423-like [Vollenhovia emeryi]XP_011863813.1 PREDICTED: zinc finger protein 423-like [Vollenhovia emeryi]
MARVQPFKRAVDAIVIYTKPHDTEIPHGVQIKEEPMDTTSNATENCILVKNYYSLVDHNYHQGKLSLSKNDALYKDINNTENRQSSNDDSIHLNDVNKTINTKCKSVKPTKEMHNTLEFKKRKCSKKVSNKIKQNVTLDCKTNIELSRKLRRCDICFRSFSTVKSCEAHKLYYELNDNLRKKSCGTNDKLPSLGINKDPYAYKCNFCIRVFWEKALLQSHLFHIHNELICSKNTIKRKAYKSKNINSSKGGPLSLTSKNEELCSNNLSKDNFKSEKVNTILINNVNESSDSNVINTENSKIKKLFNNEKLPTKKLRQPTLTEYLEFCKKKRDQLSPNKLNMENNFPSCTLDRDEQKEENPKPKLSKGHNGKIDSLPIESDNLSKTAHSILEQTTMKHEICSPKKPFVKLHADVEIMKSFLENLSDMNVEDQMTKYETSDNDCEVSYDRAPPYRLRRRPCYFMRDIRYVRTNLRSKKNKNVSKESQIDIEYDTETKRNVSDVDPKIDLKDWKSIMAYFKCKECTIPLIRCDARPKDLYQISTIDTMKNTSLATQCNSTNSGSQCNSLVEESNVQNKIMLKDLEVSLERLTAVPITVKTDINIENHDNNYFVCKVCQERFSSKLDKRRHIKSSHIAYMSSICNARYTLKHKLLQHYLCEHLSQPNECCICYTLLPDYEALKQHLNVHCLKYIQSKDSQYPIDIELKCTMSESYNCLGCNETFSSQSSLESHQSCCIIKMEKNLEDSMEEAYPKNIPEILQKNIDENTVTCDKEINRDDLRKPANSDCVAENLNKQQVSLSSAKEAEINEATQNFLVNNNLTEEKSKTVNKLQDSEGLLENSNSTSSNQSVTSSNQSVTSTQLDNTTRAKTYTPCDICGKQFQTLKNLEIHKRTFSFITDICPMCGTGFSSKRFLQTHITAAHVPHISKTYSFHCVFCNQGFFKKHDLKSHILHLHNKQLLSTLTRNNDVSAGKSDHPSIKHVTTCNICNLAFETHDCYVEHRMYYYENHTFQCSLCAQNFQGMYMFHHHNKLVHCSQDKRKSYRYICDICNEGFNHESHFHSHSMHVHSKDLNLGESAKECGERNRSDYSPNVPEKITNFSMDQQKQNKQLSNEYICQICQLKFTDTSDMLRHKELHSNDGDFKCDKCDRRCKTITLLDQHRKLTHICRDIYNGYECRICGEVLETVTSLKCHEKHFHSNIINNDTDKRENNDEVSSTKNTCQLTKYNCLFCDMKFSKASTVQAHLVNVHMDDMINKQAILKLPRPITNNNDFQKQFKISDPSLSSKDNSTQLLQRSTIQHDLQKKVVETNPASSPKDNSTQLLQKSAALHDLQKQVVETHPASSSKDNSTQLLQKSTTQHDLQKQFVETNPASSSKDNSPQLVQRSTAQQSVLDILLNKRTSTLTEDKTATELLKKFKITTKSNETTKDTPISAIPCINKSKDISTISTIAPNAATSVSSFTGPTIAKTIVSNTESKDNTSVPLPGSTNDLRYRKTYGVFSKSGSSNEFKANSVSLLKRSITNKSKTTPVSSLLPGPSSTGSTLKVIPQSWKSNEITNQKSVNHSNSAYSCPLCPLEYPDLMFFHAHLNYAHVDSVRTNKSMPQIIEIETIPMIECLLCPCNFMDEVTYKKHLRNSHTYYVYMSNSKETTQTKNVFNPSTTQNRTTGESKIPEVITVDDDENNDNIKNTSNQQIAEVTATLDCGKQDNKIGKLRVKPFAKIIETLSADSAL